MRGGLERVVEAALAAGLLASTVLLLAGLVTGGHAALRAGIVLLMSTPVARVAIVTAGLLWRRDWTFSLVSLFVLGILAAGIAVSFRP